MVLQVVENSNPVEAVPVERVQKKGLLKGRTFEKFKKVGKNICLAVALAAFVALPPLHACMVGSYSIALVASVITVALFSPIIFMLLVKFIEKPQIRHQPQIQHPIS